MPVYSSHLVDDKDQSLGRRIREHRLAKHLTLRHLADRLGVSMAKLSNIENDKGALDLAELSQLATALGVPLAALFPRSQVAHHLIRRSAEIAAEKPVMRELIGPEPGPARHHNPIRPLAEAFIGKHMEPLLVDIQPLADDQLQFVAHDHEEFLFVLRGEVEIVIKGEGELRRELLHRGDSIYFRSSLPHCTRSPGPGPAETLHVIYSIRGAIDSDDGEIGALGRRFYRRGVYEDVVREAGEKIALLRKAHGLTRSALAADVEIGVRRLARIEDGEAAPDVDLLVRLARRFRRPTEFFVSSTLETEPAYFVQRGRKIDQVPVRRRRFSARRDDIRGTNVYRSMASGFPDRGLHPYYVQIGERESDLVELDDHHGEEFVYVLDGELEFLGSNGSRDTSEILRPGDCLFVDSGVPHMLRGSSRNPFASSASQAIVVFWAPLGERYLFADDHVAEPALP